jgi:hypothetical protein
MDADRTEVTEQMIEEPGKKTRRKWTAAEKRQIVQQALRRDAVLQEVAQRHGVLRVCCTRGAGSIELDLRPPGVRPLAGRFCCR